MAKKIFCDICDSEIQDNESLGMFAVVKITEKILLDNPTNPQKEVDKIEMDLCKDCAKRVEEFVKKIKEEIK